MSATIRLIEGWRNDYLFVPGTDPAQIVADGNAFLADDEAFRAGLAEGLSVTTPLDKVRIAWFRVNPCGPNVCGDNHNGHWTETPEKTRGGFQGAEVEFGFPDDETHERK
jgi:hypothetical protein